MDPIPTYHFDADPYLIYHFDADPDADPNPTYHRDADPEDPDPDYYLMRFRILIFI